MNEFQQHVQGYTHFSSPGKRFRLWGKEIQDFTGFTKSIEPIGISFHYPQRWVTFRPGHENNPDSIVLRALAEIADRIDVPLVWFGEHAVDYRGFIEGDSLRENHSVEFGEISVDSETRTFSFDGENVPLDELDGEIQEAFGTDFVETGSSKPENKTTPPFAYYSKTHLPSRYTIQDIDAVHAKDPVNPSHLIEIKRSDDTPGSWQPYTGDVQQYHLLLKVAEEAGLDCFIVKHQKRRLESVDGNEDRVRFYEGISAPSVESVPVNIQSKKDAEEFIGDGGDPIDVSEALDRMQQSE